MSKAVNMAARYRVTIYAIKMPTDDGDCVNRRVTEPRQFIRCSLLPSTCKNANSRDASGNCEKSCRDVGWEVACNC